jgi:hypothetical protein
MAIFQKVDPVKKQQADLETALRSKRRDRDSLAERLHAAEAAVISHRAKARDLACDGGDDAAITAAETKMREQQDRCVTLTGALGDVDKAVADLERQVADVIDQQVRAVTAREIEGMLAQWDEASALFDVGCKAIEAISILTGHTIAEAVATGHFARDAREQLPRATEVVQVLLENYRRGVTSGAGPATLAKPPQLPPRLAVVPTEPELTVFVTRNIKYMDQQGAIVCCGQNRRHSLPKRIADLALAANAAITFGGDNKSRIQNFEGASGMTVPIEENCIWIGPAGKEAGPKFIRPGGPPVHSSLTEFTVVDRGGPFAVMVPREEPVPMAATRSAEDGEP